MLVIPGQSGHTCDGPTRREFLRVGSLGIFGISLSQTLALRDAHAATTAADALRRRPGLRQRQVRHPAVPAGRPQPHRHLGSEARRALQHPRRVRRHRHEGRRHPPLRDDAAAGRPGRQVHAHPLDELHPEGALQPHRGDLPDADRLSARPRLALRPARTADAGRLPHRRLARLEAQAARRRDAAVRRDAAAAPGVQRDR